MANWFICNIDRDAGDSITHLKLQKLLYYAQAWSLALYDKALFEDDFEAWAHGPVIPAIYEEYRDYGYDALPTCDCKNMVKGEAEDLLRDVKRVYGEHSAKFLEKLTHSEDPWKITRGNLAPEQRCNKHISKTLMRNYYKQKLKDSE